MQIKPLGSRVLVKPLKQEEIKGGIILPDTAEKERKEQGEVVAIGAGEDVQKLGLAVGNKVLFGKYSGEEIKMDDQDYRFLNHDDVLAVIE
ncbi:MAG: co-chaperone GroES [Candidatus Doudnabacteria bacterium RIFCSPHIGHO2_02_FULL_46_11]|uniref:Co-chaperonin GroES n=1 Tax=Candidatus Doudnabacteria bacterium RIFCSPHIGHO2_02_FULL_46_11 TaxID=1817832 RepID=A0A1F5P545_9BACT|nr:MAG: co-chaperone GroES [Candidatus Doudnabacteria bacterium RIFCSPHIGHO2_02_FULL_46_11]